MIHFKYIDANTLNIDSFRLGKKIYELGFIPTHAISLWRGGTPVGLGVGEYFRLKGHFINHTTVATASYTDINLQTDVIIKGLEHLIKVIAKEDKLLIIDDIYDSGNTINAIIESIKKTARLNTPDEILVACIHKKRKKHKYNHNLVYLYEVDENIWISYPHEISELINNESISNKSKEIFEIINKNYFPVEDITVRDNYLYINSNDLLLDSLKLGVNIYNSNFIPDFLIAIWPGGISSGLPIHEYFKYRLKIENKNNKIPDHISINTSLSHYSYKTNIIGIKYLEDNINYSDKILIINTIFSTGRITNHIIDKLKDTLRRNININNIKVASVYYNPNEDATWTTNPIVKVPHYYLKKINKDVIFPQQIHRLLKPEKELINLNKELYEVIYSN